MMMRATLSDCRIQPDTDHDPLGGGAGYVLDIWSAAAARTNAQKARRAAQRLSGRRRSHPPLEAKCQPRAALHIPPPDSLVEADDVQRAIAGHIVDRQRLQTATRAPPVAEHSVLPLSNEWSGERSAPATMPLYHIRSSTRHSARNMPRRTAPASATQATGVRPEPSSRAQRRGVAPAC